MSKWKLIYQGDPEGFNRQASIDYWQGQSASARFAEAQSLIAEALKMKGKSIEDVSGLLRTTAVIKFP